MTNAQQETAVRPEPTPERAAPIGTYSTAPTASPRGVVTGPDGKQAVFMSEEEYYQEAMQESHALHLGVLGLFGVLALAAAAYTGFGSGGPVGAVTVAIGALIGLAGNTLLNTVVGWIIGKLFGADSATFPVLLLRFAAVTVAYSVALAGLAAVLGPMFAILLTLPVLVILVVWLIGMDLVQALVFSIVLGMANWLLVTFALASFASAVMG